MMKVTTFFFFLTCEIHLLIMSTEIFWTVKCLVLAASLWVDLNLPLEQSIRKTEKENLCVHECKDLGCALVDVRNTIAVKGVKSKPFPEVPRLAYDSLSLLCESVQERHLTRSFNI